MPPPLTDIWRISPIASPHLQWGANRRGERHRCKYCGILLLTGEDGGFCCGPHGNRLHVAPPLPPLPSELETLAQDSRISHASNTLNLIFSFASLESTGKIAQFDGPPGFFALDGRIYHRIRPNHPDSAVHWLLYDGFARENPPRPEKARTLPPDFLDRMRTTLLRCNPFVRQLRMLGQLDPAVCPQAHIVLADSPESPEIAAILRYSNTSRSDVQPRRLIISRLNNVNSSLPVVSRLWEPLVYPLFFPQGTLGWGLSRVDSAAEDLELPPTAQARDAESTQIWYYRIRLLHDVRFAIFGRLTNEYVVDMFSRNLEARMCYIRSNQRKIQEEDALQMGVDSIEPNDNIYLPASFLGSNRWASEQIADSLAIAATFGPPTFFVTFTCNTSWPEITSQLRPGQTFHDIPVVVCRVFKRKLALFERTLRSMFPNAGPVLYLIHSIEFQKRGAPHAHILIKYTRDCTTPEAIDSVISAELPLDPSDANLVHSSGLIHNCGPYCGTCRFHYPHPLQSSTTIDNTGRVHYRRRREADARVVPHCLPLVRQFRCHINFEVANTSHMFQYLFKYIHKGSRSFFLERPLSHPHPTGPDHTKFNIFAHGAERNRVDEITDYWDGRYLSAPEATWRILGFHLTKKDPAVSALPIHLPSTAHHHRQYSRSSNRNLQSLSLLEHYFHRPSGFFPSHDGSLRPFASLTYSEYFTLFRLAPATSSGNAPSWNERDVDHTPMRVIMRQHTHSHVARLHPARPSEGERFYLRTILQHKPVASFSDALIVDGVHHSCYQDAANALGLFASMNEGELAIHEAISSLVTPHQLRVLFVHLLVNDCISSPRAIWDSYAESLAQDFVLQHNNSPNLGHNDALDHLNHLLEEYRANLDTYGLPQPLFHSSEVTHELQRWEAHRGELAMQAAEMIAAFNPQQHHIFDIILEAVHSHKPHVAFIDGPAGRGKTFLVNALCAQLRAEGRIVLATATSGYAAQLYPGGRTTHSTFKVRDPLLHHHLSFHLSNLHFLPTIDSCQ